MKNFQLFLSLTYISQTNAYPGFASRIPNGYSVPNPDAEGEIASGVGHFNPAGGGRRNPFGEDFEANNKRWTQELCESDSDGDGRSNGEELGDPDCVWEEGDEPSGPALSHPGIADFVALDDSEEEEEMPLPLDEVTEAPPGEESTTTVATGTSTWGASSSTTAFSTVSTTSISSTVTTEMPVEEETETDEITTVPPPEEKVTTVATTVASTAFSSTTTELPAVEDLTTEAPLDEDFANETYYDDWWGNETSYEEDVEEVPSTDEIEGTTVAPTGMSSTTTAVSTVSSSTTTELPAVEELTTEAPLYGDFDNETMNDDDGMDNETFVESEPLPEVIPAATQLDDSSSNYYSLSGKVISVALLLPAVFAQLFF